MEKIIRQQDKYVTIKQGKKDVTVFVACDGKEFSSEKDCKEYEFRYLRYKIWDEIEKCHESIPEIDVFVHPKTDEELSAVLNKFNGRTNLTVNDIEMNKTYKWDMARDIFLRTVFKVGDWIAYCFIDGGDYSDEYRVYSLEYVKSSVKFLEDLK